LIGFPENEPDDAAPLVARARTAMAAALDLKLDFDVTLCKGGEAAEMLGRY
jgi:hypothetical protein